MAYRDPYAPCTTFKMHPTYGPLVIEATGCDPSWTHPILQVMRDEFRTLDGLDRTKFLREARKAYKVVKMMEAEKAAQPPGKA